MADEQLMQLVQHDDVDAFGLLYDRHNAAALRLARRICGTPERAADATQEAFLTLWRSRTGFDADRGSLRSWVLLLARNKAVDSLRRTGPYDRGTVRDDCLAERLEANERTETEVARRGDAERVRWAVAALPTEQRRVIELAFFAGLSHTEISELLSLPAGTVKGRIRLGLEKLRRDLEPALEATA